MGVGETVGEGEKPGLFVTTLRGEMTPHAAIIASTDSTHRLSQWLRTGAERKSIEKDDAASGEAVGSCTVKFGPMCKMDHLCRGTRQKTRFA